MLKKIVLVTLLSVVGLYADIVAQAKQIVKSIDTNNLQKMLEENPNIPLIDVRIKSDILKQGGYIQANKNVNISRDKLEFLISNEVNPEDQFVVYCYDGNISLLATKQLLEMGYKNVLHYKDSYNGWSKANLPSRSLDKYPESFLYSKVQEVASGVYTSIGITQPYLYESAGHNNNLGFVIGEESVLVWNAGTNYLLAQALHKEIKKITNKPVKYVILENSQGHAVLGSNYWKEQGAQIIAQDLVTQELEEKKTSMPQRMQKTLGDKFEFTQLVFPDETFTDSRSFDLGGRIVEAHYFGYAHEHSDICIWLPKEKILFAGDLAFNNRLLPIFEITEIDKWLEAWESVEALEAQIVVPGHGEVTDMATVRKYTKDYLVYLRDQIQEILDNDGDLTDAYKIDMSAYEHLDTYRELGRQNIATVFKQMEF